MKKPNKWTKVKHPVWGTELRVPNERYVDQMHEYARHLNSVTPDLEVILYMRCDDPEEEWTITWSVEREKKELRFTDHDKEEWGLEYKGKKVQIPITEEIKPYRSAKATLESAVTAIRNFYYEYEDKNPVKYKTRILSAALREEDTGKVLAKILSAELREEDTGEVLAKEDYDESLTRKDRSGLAV